MSAVIQRADYKSALVRESSQMPLGRIFRSMSIPSNLKFTKSHEWVKIDGDQATIGITDHAQSELGDIVFVELPQIGRQVQEGDQFGTVESVKTVSDLYAPLAGEVIEVNPALASQSELVNSDPYGQGWMAKIKISGGDDGLLSPEEYQALLDS